MAELAGVGLLRVVATVGVAGPGSVGSGVGELGGDGVLDHGVVGAPVDAGRHGQARDVGGVGGKGDAGDLVNRAGELVVGEVAAEASGDEAATERAAEQRVERAPEEATEPAGVGATVDAVDSHAGGAHQAEGPQAGGIGGGEGGDEDAAHGVTDHERAVEGEGVEHAPEVIDAIGDGDAARGGGRLTEAGHVDADDARALGDHGREVTEVARVPRQPVDEEDGGAGALVGVGGGPRRELEVTAGWIAGLDGEGHGDEICRVGDSGQGLAAMRLHHLALGAADVERVAEFYRDLLGLAELERHHAEDGALRSIWLDLGGAILMVERSEAAARQVEGVGRGPFLIAVRCTAEERGGLERALEAAGHPIEDRTDHSSYTRDPEGNRVAVSCYEG